jgi:predicted AlkP superfamily pyrophosphatase or phosphodiesterase
VTLHNDEVVSSGEVIGVAPRPGRQARIEAALLGRHDGYECWRRERLPAAWHYGTHPRVPPIVCQADEGVHVTHAARLTQGGRISPGAHGYAPEHPSMRAVFIARGPRVVSGATLPPIRATDVHPLLLELLGLPPMPRDGHASATAAALRSSSAAR